MDDVKCVIHWVQEELEDLQAQALETPEPKPETQSVTRSGRRSKPTRLCYVVDLTFCTWYVSVVNILEII